MGVKYAQEKGIVNVVNGEWQLVKEPLKHADLIVLPSVFQKKIRGQITHVSKKMSLNIFLIIIIFSI